MTKPQRVAVTLSYDGGDDGPICPRLVHRTALHGSLHFEVRRLDGNIGKVSFYITSYDQSLASVPQGVRLFDSNGQQCPQDGRQFSIVWWEDYTLMYGTEVMCRITAPRQHTVSMGPRTHTEQELLARSRQPKLVKTPPPLLLANTEEAWIQIDAFQRHSGL